MDIKLRRAIEPELESGERVLWAARPSLLRYVLRGLPIKLLFVGALIWAAVTYIIPAVVARGEDVSLILAAMAAVPLYVAVASIYLWRKTIYAITDRRLLRTGGWRLLGNRPGQSFAYRPEELRFLRVRSSWLSHHVYFDRKGWGDNRSVPIGFENVRDAEGVGDRIRAWLDEFQQQILSDMVDRRVVTNEDHGFRLEVPASWDAEIGIGDDAGPAGATPDQWEHEMCPWDGESRGWNRLRVTGPAHATVAVEVIRAPTHRSDEEINPMVERALELAFQVDRETSEIEFLGMPATLTTWSRAGMELRTMAVRSGDAEYRILLLAPSNNPLVMAELQTIAESFHLREAEVEKAPAVAEQSDRRAPHPGEPGRRNYAAHPSRLRDRRSRVRHP